MGTNRTDVVLVKLGAVVIVVLSLQNLSNYVAYLAVGVDMLYVPIVAFILNFAIPVGMAVALWKFPNTVLGHSMTNEPTTDDTQVATETALFIGVSLIGLYTFVFGIVDLLYFETIRFVQRGIAESRDYMDYEMSPQNIAGRLTNVTQIVFGLILILGRRKIAAMIRKIRTAGTGAT